MLKLCFIRGMKTIFITSFFGLSARNILSTSILNILSRNANSRVVILAPQEKSDDYRRYFSAGKPNVIVEGVVLSNTRSEATQGIQLETASKSRLEQLFFSLFLHSSDTNSWKVMRLAERKFKGRYLKTFFHWILAKLGNFKFFRSLLRFLDYRLMPKDYYQGYFDQYRPDLIFATDIFNDHDVQVMREARARKISIVGMVRSWDNITSHGLNRIIPDKLIVHTPKIREEAIQHNDIKLENIFVSGIPHYDRYLSDLRTPREQFFKQMGLDPKKKTIFFAPPSDIYAKHNPVATQVIKELSKIYDIQLIIRLYLVGEVDLGDIKTIPGKIAIDAPRQSLQFLSADIAPKEDAHLADLLYHSDVVVAFASTLAIDAAVLGKPVIFIGFDGGHRPYWQSLRQYYDFDHQRFLINTGGVKLAASMDDLLKNIQNYLNDPDLDKKERKNVTDLFCWKMDGRSGERAAKFLIEQFSK